ncbi:sigma-54-dependent Fis family transcriptional regulator [Brevibacillus panacihumi]|uniref:sigma-54-dependent Fis family transcriptional regulator n=1 Tax=Brevibacillus panacihumi TaxID=497735 RepID=UPI003D19E434
MSTIVQQSWKRCQASNLKATENAYDQIISMSRIKEIIRDNHLLIRTSLPLFERLEPFLANTEHIALLADSDGNIIHTVGDPTFADHAQKVQLQIGANWNEGFKGTNAIGTALIERVPVHVQGEQHYFLENQFLTCSASPVFSAAGELLGVVNISTRKEYNHPLAMTLVCMVAESLQNRFLYAEADRVVALPHADARTSSRSLPLIGLDRDDRIVGINESAKKRLGAAVLGSEMPQLDKGMDRTMKDNRRRIWPSAKTAGLKPFPRLAGSCPHFLQAKLMGQKAALVDFPVLILGESGTGKELFAQMIHEMGSRSNAPFIAVNCSAIPENLIESELFGYEGGSFTGAQREGKIGKFEAAKKGTIFLDEIGDMSLRSQAALLRVLQEKVVTPVGSNQPRPIHARVIAATHRHLPDEIKAGRFRADLYYRLKGVMIQLPPLRQRTDILPLAEHLLRQLTPGSSASISREAQELLAAYAWPGNIRELQSVLIQAAFLADGGDIEAVHIQLEGPDEAGDFSVRKQELPSLKESEMEAIKRAIRTTGGNVSQAAKLLQIGRNTLYRKLAEYRISLPATWEDV